MKIRLLPPFSSISLGRRGQFDNTLGGGEKHLSLEGDSQGKGAVSSLSAGYG